ncbi:MAG: integrase [Martelella sp.]|uniref:Mu transposase C-terminal domain-containing protein n=1 Tax=Martelella sp. TaxID=1969699 RepID=UPI000C619CB7|nr:Mu transposase C-terminal domain-containing protein [Martelella sp.]MAU23397.1 integrase [Martelella sp.]MAU23713.1 integrase [Martelella sp.]
MTRPSPAPDLSGIALEEWEKARRRLEVLKPLAEAERRSRGVAQAAADELGISLTLVYRLLARYEAAPRLTSLLPERRGRREGQLVLSAEVEEIVGAVIDELFLTRQKQRVSDVVMEVRKRCRALGFAAPSRKAIDLRLRMRPAAEVHRKRHGRKAARDRFAPAVGSLDAPWPLSLVQIDHTLVDVIVVDSRTREPIQRPWLTLAIDVYSRCVAGFYLSLDPPSATSVALCIAHAALPKDNWLRTREVDEVWPVSGIPERLHLDNAKEFRSAALKQGCVEHGIDIDYRPVRTPHYGGHIERLIGTMMGKVHLLPGTTFSDVRAKGDLDPSKSAAMTLDEVESWLAHAITGVYHRELHRSIGVTPLVAWQRGLEGNDDQPGRGSTTPVVDARKFLIDFLPMERRLVRRQGVFLHTITYWSDVLRTLIGEREKMVVRYDPRDLSRVYLWAPDGRYYDLSYADLRRPPISLWEHRLALKRLREEGREQVDEDAIFATIDRMRGIAERAVVETKTMRRQRERRLQAARAVAVKPDVTKPASPNPPAFEPLPENERLFTNVEEWL